MSCVTWCDFAGVIPDKTDPDSLIVNWTVNLGTFSNWFRNQILGITAGVAPVLPIDLYIKFHSSASTAELTGTEISGGNYFKVPVSFARVNDIQLWNPGPVTSQLATEDWEDILSVSLWDQDDNFYAFGNLFAPLSIPAGRGVQFLTNAIVVGLGVQTDSGFTNYYINQALGILLGTAPAIPASLSIALYSGNSSATQDGGEISGNNYARIPVMMSRLNDWVYANSGSLVSNTASADWAPFTSYGAIDANGNRYFWENASAATIVPSGEALRIANEAVRVSLANVLSSVTSGAATTFTVDSQNELGRPRFTPDPPPFGADPSLVDWMQRQFARIEDWWPKDYGRRIRALEEGQPYASGSWPIVDSSEARFIGVVPGNRFACGDLAIKTLTTAQYGAFNTTDATGHWSERHQKIFHSFGTATESSPSFWVYDRDVGTEQTVSHAVLPSGNAGSRSQHGMVIGQPNNPGLGISASINTGEWFIHVVRDRFSFSTLYIRAYDASDNSLKITFNTGTNVGADIYVETPNYVMAGNVGATASVLPRIYSKSATTGLGTTWGSSMYFQPRDPGPFAWVGTSMSDDSVLMCIRNGTNGYRAAVWPGTIMNPGSNLAIDMSQSYLLTNAPTVTVPTLDFSGASEGWVGPGVVASDGLVYFPVNSVHEDGTTEVAFFLKTSKDGRTVIDSPVKAFPDLDGLIATKTWTNNNSRCFRITDDLTTIWYARADRVYWLDVPSQVVSWCDINDTGMTNTLPMLTDGDTASIWARIASVNGDFEVWERGL